MATRVDVISLDSGVLAPEVGDGGCLGFPSPIDESGNGKHPFLEIYNDLMPLRLITDQVEAFKRYLDTHGHERLRFYAEGGVYEDVDAIFETYGRRGERPPRFEVAIATELSIGRYQIACDGEKYTCEWDEPFYRFQPRVVLKPDIEVQINRLFEPEPGWDLKFYYTSGAIGAYEDLENIRELLIICDGPFEINLV